MAQWSSLVARGLALTAALVLGCSLLAPSSDELSSGYLPRADGSGDVVEACPPGTKSCSGSCVPATSPATGCGDASCAPCAAAHAAAICVGTACAVGPCENGWANCNERAEDGCEVDTRDSALFCGSCLRSCGGETPRCEDGECVPLCHAVKMTAASARIAMPGARFGFGSGDFTVELWIARHSDFNVPVGQIFTSDEAYAASAIVISVKEDRVACRITEPSPTTQPTLEVPVPKDGSWHHLACVREAGKLSVFVDGVSYLETTNTNAVAASASAAIGRPSGYPTFDSAAVAIGPLRISSTARYTAPFRPRTFWTVDAETVAQLLTRRSFDGDRVYDEAGGDDDSTAVSAVVAAESAPCR